MSAVGPDAVGAAPATGYKYRPLTEDGTIRLLRLAPGQGQVHFELQTVSINSGVQYEAISYAWGEPTLKESVLCDGELLDIPASLSAALRWLRLPDQPRVLWADAVCINQADIAEKNKQVAMMGEIYRKPAGILIWLGEDTEGLDGLVESIDRVRELLPREFFHAAELAEESERFHYETSNLRRENKHHLHFHHHDWTPINKILCRPWFERKWIIQEVVMAPRDIPRTMICGNLQFEWDSLATIGYLMASYSLAMSAAGLSAFYGSGPTSRTFLSNDARPLRSLFNAQMIKLLRQFRGELSLLDCVTAMGNSCCTDPRDHVYALLGMGAHGSDLPADYDLTTEEVFTRFAVSTLVTDGNLKVLSLAPHCGFPYPHLPPMRPRAGLPSWVPDLMLTSSVSPLVSHTIRPALFRAGGDPASAAAVAATAKIRVSGDRKVLHFRGMVVDTIRRIGPNIANYPYPTAEDIAPRTGMAHLIRKRQARYFEECKKLASEVDGVGGGGARGSWAEQTTESKRRFALTMLCGMVGMRDPVSEEVLGTYLEYMDFMGDSFAPDFKIEPEVRDRLVRYGGQIEGSLNGLVMGRSFCITEAGRLGQIRLEAKVGDLVCVIMGAEVPYVIRPTGRDTYILIGDCYISDIMEGEAVGDDRYEGVDILLE